MRQEGEDDSRDEEPVRLTRKEVRKVAGKEEEGGSS